MSRSFLAEETVDRVEEVTEEGVVVRRSVPRRLFLRAPSVLVTELSLPLEVPAFSRAFFTIWAPRLASLRPVPVRPVPVPVRSEHCVRVVPWIDEDLRDEAGDATPARPRDASLASVPSARALRKAKALLGLVMVIVPLPREPEREKLLSVLSEHPSLASDWKLWSKLSV